VGSPAHGDRADVDAAFEKFVTEGSRRLLQSAYLITGDRGQSEDLLQAALLQTARNWRSVHRAPGAYAHRVLVNMLHDRRRRLGRRVLERRLDEVGERPGSGRDLADTVAERDALIAAMKGLALRQREVVVLRFWGGFSVAETAAAIGISEGSVKTHTSRALARLREVTGSRDEEKEVRGAQ
jgi:RNA polymerase sigma-70 factor (sigma-E family)